MSSLIPGYDYDIFISYRQKDNKYDGWVTEFVDNLKRELEATFKEDVSVYFDINPHDGLLETHDVDASLKEKLKCLIFIPVISQTYCDSKSFAWQHEFVAFNEMSKEDQFGQDIKLAGGNVASRILPIKIHDLDPEDKTLLENELGGVLRCIEFIYKAAGVNRPLRANEDHPQDNLNKTYYRDQINKVANAIKEIITSIKRYNQNDREVPKEVVKAKPDKPKNNKPKIIIASVIILALIVLGYFLMPKHSKPKEKVNKSIAVLPFKSLSDDPDKQYLADGMMDAILLHLSKIKDLRVMSRTSVEQYRKTDKTLNVIGKELDVEYLLEGSFQKFGDNARLIVQLIKTGAEGHVWANDYDRNWSDIFKVQSEVAQKIADELHAAITPEEKQLINKIPTTNLTAYDFYQQAREEHTKYWIDNWNKAALQKAEDFYRKSLKYDSTFDQAYSGLAMAYWDKHFFHEYLSKNFMDSVLILANIALSHDNNLSEPYTLKGRYYDQIGKPEQAIEEFDKAIKLNPNDWMAYYGKGRLYVEDDFVKSIYNLLRAASLNRGEQLPALLRSIGEEYLNVGFPEKASYYWKEALNLDGDSSSYYFYLMLDDFFHCKFEKAVEYAYKVYSIDSNYYYDVTQNRIDKYLSLAHLFNHNYEESLKYLNKHLQNLEELGETDIGGMYLFGYIYWENGYKEKAEYFFNETIKNSTKQINLGRRYTQTSWVYYDLAGVYAFQGETNKALENLRVFNQKRCMDIEWVMGLKTDPLFDSIRNEPEFQKIAKEVEAKYQAEHERVRKWLEEQGS
jgi:TolB-like protein